MVETDLKKDKAAKKSNTIMDKLKSLMSKTDNK